MSADRQVEGGTPMRSPIESATATAAATPNATTGGGDYFSEKKQSASVSYESAPVTAVASPAESAKNSVYNVDVEKGPTERRSGSSLATYVVPTLAKGVKAALSETPSRWTRFRVWYNPYRQLFTFCLTINIVGIIVASTGHFPYANIRGPAFGLGNILAASMMRNELFLRGVFWVTVKLSQKWTPLPVRIFLTAFLQHLGGIHSGTAVSGLAWLIFAVVRAFQHHSINHNAVLAFGVLTAVVVAFVAAAAIPTVREKHHNVFEHHHRLLGWSALVFVWIFVIMDDTQDHKTGAWDPTGSKIAHAQEFWFSLGITAMIFIPWLTVRKVPVEITIPSPRVAIVKLERGIQQGLLGRISRHGVLEYHGFGIISEGIGSGCHYMIVGAQGDWTKGMVNDPPKQIWTREMKFAGLPYLAHLYRRGICICTGSGIGAVLSTCVQLDNWFLIWIGSDMEATFGPVLFDMIKRRIPKERYILFDTKKEGCRPDTMRMLRDIYDEFEAEVVIITSNPKGNAELMQGCKENNMHAFGPLWDS